LKTPGLKEERKSGEKGILRHFYHPYRSSAYPHWLPFEQGLARIDSVKQEIQNHTFILTITTRRPLEEVCAQTVTPFQLTTPLAVEGLPAGVYTVIANGVTASFELKTGTPFPAQ